MQLLYFASQRRKKTQLSKQVDNHDTHPDQTTCPGEHISFVAQMLMNPDVSPTRKQQEQTSSLQDVLVVVVTGLDKCALMYVWVRNLDDPCFCFCYLYLTHMKH